MSKGKRAGELERKLETKPEKSSREQGSRQEQRTGAKNLCGEQEERTWKENRAENPLGEQEERTGTEK
jgi:hypothetical protein